MSGRKEIIVKVVCAQLQYRGREEPPGLERIAANVAFLDGLLRDRIDPDTDLLLLGEFWLASPDGPGEYGASAVTLPGPLEGLLGELAAAHAIMIYANVVEVASDGQLFDTSVLVDASGETVLRYREIAGGLIAGSAVAGPVGGEAPASGTWGAGLADWLPVVDTPFGRFATLVGSDLTYPELSCALTRAGVDVLLHAAKEGPATEGVYQSLKAARALEGGYAIVSCNIADGSEVSGPWAASRGHSRVIDARGSILAESDTDGEDLLYCDVDTTLASEVRAQPRWGRRRSQDWGDRTAAMFSADSSGSDGT